MNTHAKILLLGSSVLGGVVLFIGIVAFMGFLVTNFPIIGIPLLVLAFSYGIGATFYFSS